jgi:hypothetical protein
MPRKKNKTSPAPKPEGYVFGRPAIYRAEFCGMLIAHMQNGGSFPTFAAEVPCSIETIYDWSDPKSDRFKPDFSEARKTGESFLMKHDEMIGKLGMTGKFKSFGQAAWIFTMKNRYPKHYRDRQETIVTDPDGNPIQPMQVIVNIPRNGSEKPEDENSDD